MNFQVIWNTCENYSELHNYDNLCVIAPFAYGMCSVYSFTWYLIRWNDNVGKPIHEV